MGFVIGIVLVVGFIAIWDAAVGSRRELRRMRRLLWILLSGQQPDFALVGRRLSLHLDIGQSWADRQEFTLGVDGYEWPCVAKGPIDGTAAEIVGFRGDYLVVSKAEPKAAKTET